MTRTLWPVAACLLLLAACGTAPEKAVFEARSLYDASVLAPAANYNELPRNGTPQCAVAKVCSDQSVVDSLRKADKAAETTLDAAEDVVRNHPTWDASAAVDAAQNAVTAAQKILDLYGVK